MKIREHMESRKFHWFGNKFPCMSGNFDQSWTCQGKCTNLVEVNNFNVDSSFFLELFKNLLKPPAYYWLKMFQTKQSAHNLSFYYT